MTPRRSRLTASLVVLLVVAVSLVLRRHAIAYGVPLNVDEAEILAAGRRAALRPWIPMETSSANTYFVLWPMLLGFLQLVGIPLTLHVAHVLSTCGYAAMVSIVWIWTARRWGWVWTTVFVLPPAYWLMISYTDFMQLGTELAPALLLVIGAIVGFPQHKPVSPQRLAVVAALASLAPWFKPQSGPLAITLVVAACCFAYVTRESREARHRPIATGAWLLFGGLAPTALLVVVMLLGGTFGLFMDEPVAFLWAYLTHGVNDFNGAGDSTAPLSEKAAFLGRLSVVNALSFSWAALGLAGVWLCRRGPAWRVAVCAGIWAAPIAAAVVTLLVSWPIFVHYAIFLYAGTAMAGIAGTGLASSSLSSNREPITNQSMPGLVGLTSVVVALSAIFVLYGTRTFDTAPRGQGMLPTLGAHRGNAALEDLCPRRDTVFVWGWAAELYAYYDWKPASRYVTYGLPVANTPHRDTYRRRLMDELTSNPPKCIVEATGDNWFGPTTEDETMAELMPESRAWVEGCYAPNEVTFNPDDRITVWERSSAC